VAELANTGIISPRDLGSDLGIEKKFILFLSGLNLNLNDFNSWA
jgi:hypothetical protein